MNGNGRDNDWWGDFMNLLAMAYFRKMCPKLEARGLKMLVVLRGVDWRKKLLIKSKK